MKMYMQREQELVQVDEGQEEIPEESDSDEEDRKKIGDRLFDQGEDVINLKEMA